MIKRIIHKAKRKIICLGLKSSRKQTHTLTSLISDVSAQRFAKAVKEEDNKTKNVLACELAAKHLGLKRFDAQKFIELIFKKDNRVKAVENISQLPERDQEILRIEDKINACFVERVNRKEFTASWFAAIRAYKIKAKQIKSL
jgi:hypothetical protein